MLIISTLTGATFGSFAKELSQALSPLSLLFVSEVLTLFFLFLSFGLIPSLRSIFRLSKSKFLPLLLVGIFSGVIGPLLLFTSLSITSAVNVGLFARTDMIFLILIAHAVLQEKLKQEHLLAMLFSTAGILFIVFRGFSEGLTLRAGDLLIIIGALSYALGSIIFRKYLRNIEPHLALMARSCLAITFFFLVSPFVNVTFLHQLEGIHTNLLPSLIGFALVARFFSTTTYYEAIDRISITTASLIGSTDIFFSALFAHLYLGETIEWYHFVGGLLLLMGGSLLAIYHTPTTKERFSVTVRHHR